MRVSVKSLLAAAIVGVASLTASAATISGDSIQNNATYNQVGGGATYGFTSGLGFDFTGTNYNALTSIDQLNLTVTIADGDSGVGEFARDNLFLVLDGFNTGVKLNDYLNGNNATPGSSGGPPIQNAAQILAALKADGFLTGSVLDTSLGGGAGDTIGFPSVQGSIVASLDITGATGGGNGGGGNPVPLPAAAYLAPLGAGIAGIYRRKFRKAK